MTSISSIAVVTFPSIQFMPHRIVIIFHPQKKGMIVAVITYFG